jgi:hypothetical protein
MCSNISTRIREGIWLESVPQVRDEGSHSRCRKTGVRTIQELLWASRLKLYSKATVHERPTIFAKQAVGGQKTQQLEKKEIFTVFFAELWLQFSSHCGQEKCYRATAAINHKNSLRKTRSWRNKM